MPSLCSKTSLTTSTRWSPQRELLTFTPQLTGVKDSNSSWSLLHYLLGLKMSRNLMFHCSTSLSLLFRVPFLLFKQSISRIVCLATTSSHCIVQVNRVWAIACQCAANSISEFNCCRILLGRGVQSCGPERSILNFWRTIRDWASILDGASSCRKGNDVL